VSPLSTASLPQYLLARGLLSPEDVVDRGVSVVSRNRSHAVSLIEVDSGRGFVVKQADPDRDADPRRLDREAEIYRLAATRPALREALPTAYELGGSAGLLVLELVEHGATLLEHAYGTGDCPPQLAGALGTALGSAHRALAGCAPAGFTGRRPWVLDVLEPGGADFAWNTPGADEVLDSLRDHAHVRAALGRARQHWRVQGVIHGDVKWDNCCVSGGDGDAPEVKLIDWELADVGDWAWDVAGVLQEHATLAALTASSPCDVRRDASPAAFWAAYRSAADLAPEAARGIAKRSATFAGARLVQTALEYAAQRSAHAPEVDHVLELALRVLDDPAGLMPDASTP
jgi:hypothetical protein